MSAIGRAPRMQSASPLSVGGVWVVLIATAVSACGPASQSATAAAAVATTRAHPATPPCGRVVPPGGRLQGALEQTPDDGILCLEAGVYPGPVAITRGVTIWGPPDAIVRSSGEGTTVHVTGDGTRLLGFTVDGSGGRFDVLDAAVRIEADDVHVEGLRIERAVFGLLVEKSNRVTLRRNEVIGADEGPHGLRGDPIRMWETRHSRVEGNRVISGRDVVIWYASDNEIVGNYVEGGRYGTHLMYSHRNRIVGNMYRSNVVGIFLMYCRDVAVRDNVLLASQGAAGVGLGIKESGNLQVTGNAFLQNTVGAYLDTTPVQMDHANVFAGNTFALSSTALVFHGSETRNTFRGNVLRDNHAQVRVEGNGDALGVTWTGNYYDDYAGYDLDDDGVGDLPYAVQSLSGELVGKHPDLALLHGTAALWLIDAVTHVAPLLAPKLVMEDPHPAMVPPPPEVTDAG